MAAPRIYETYLVLSPMTAKRKATGNVFRRSESGGYARSKFYRPKA
jgi:hypothetical protein